MFTAPMGDSSLFFFKELSSYPVEPLSNDVLHALWALYKAGIKGSSCFLPKGPGSVQGVWIFVIFIKKDNSTRIWI